MPSPRIYTYVQNNFFVGERKTSLSFDKGTTSSVQELLNYRVLKSGAIRRRPGTRLEFDISSRINPRSTILKFLEFSVGDNQGYVVLTKLGKDVALYYLDSDGGAIRLYPTAYRAVSYPLGDGIRDNISLDSHRNSRLLDILAIANTNPLKIIDIEELGKSIFILFEEGLPYRLFEEDNRLHIAPYYYKTDLGIGYDDFIRSLPISNVKASFSDVFYTIAGAVIGADNSTLVIGNENLDEGTCRAFLRLDGSHDVPSSRVDTSKMALKDYLFKPIIFNVIPSNPEVISSDVGSVYKEDTNNEGVPIRQLAYLADWDLVPTYNRSTLLSNLNEQCRIQDFSYNPVINNAATSVIGNSTEIVGSKAQLIRELLYGRKYMIIPYEVVGEQSGTTPYHTVLPRASIAAEAITATEVNTEIIATGLSRENEDTFSTISVRNFTLKEDAPVNQVIRGTITEPIPGLDSVHAPVGFTMLRVAFPEEYVQLVNGVRGTRFNQLPWNSVVLGDWLSFRGVSISRGELGTRDNEVLNRNIVITLHAGLLADSSKVFEGVSSILVHRASVSVNNNTRPSGSVARFVANSRTNPDGTSSREFVFSAGGSADRHVPDTVSTRRDNFKSYRRLFRGSVSGLSGSQNSYSPSVRANNLVSTVYSTDGDSCYRLSFTSGTRPSLRNQNTDDYGYYTEDGSYTIYGAVSNGSSSDYYIIYKGDEYGWSTIHSDDTIQSRNGDYNLIPGDRSGSNSNAREYTNVALHNELDNVNFGYTFIQGNHITNLTINNVRTTGHFITLLFSTSRTGNSYRILSCPSDVREVGGNSSRYLAADSRYWSIQWDSNTLGGPIIGYSVGNNGDYTLVSRKARVVVSSSSLSISVNGSSPGVTRIKDGVDSSFGNIISAGSGSDNITSVTRGRSILLHGTYFASATTRTSNPDEEISIFRDFFDPIPSNEGAATLNVTLIKPSGNRGFQGFDVIPYNILTDTAFGFNLINNNEFISDNRHATGAFDFPVLETGGSANISLGSVVAFGRHLISTDIGNFFTWFLHITKGGTLSNLDTIYMRIGGLGGTTYTLHKQSIESLEGNAEVYIQAVGDFIRERDNTVYISSPTTIELFSGIGNTLPHSFMATEFNDRVSRVYANCLIFEIGMPSTARRGGVRVIGGNDFDLGYSTSKVAYSSDDYNYAAFAAFRNNFTLVRDDSVSYFYQNENKANNFTRILNNPTSDDVKDLFIKSRYIPGSFNQQFTSAITQYLLSETSQASYVVTDSPQALTFDNYINKTGNRSQVDYLKRVVNPRGRSVNLTSAVSSFDGEGIFVASEEGLYNVPSAVGGVASLVHNQRFKFKPLVFHNRFVFISPDDLMITQVRSRERLGLKSNYSGADQISLLGSVTDIVFNQDNQVYMMPDSSGDIVVATDFDTDVAGFTKWSFGDTNTKCLKLLTASDGVKGIFERGDRGLVLVSFDESITEDFKEGTDDNTGERFTSRVVSNALVSADTADTGLFRGHIKKIHIDDNLCSQIKVGFVADNTISVEYDYVKQDSQGVDLPYNQPLDSGGGVIGYNPRVTLSQDGLTDCNGIIYGFRFTGVLDGF